MYTDQNIMNPCFSFSFTDVEKRTFKKTTSTHYTGPGEIKVLDNPLCNANFCVMKCFTESAECRVAALDKQKCQCHLYNRQFYDNSNARVGDTAWDLLTSYYYKMI